MRMRTAIAAFGLVAVSACSGPTGSRPVASPGPAGSSAAPSPSRTPAPVFPRREWRRGSVAGADFAALDRTLEGAGSTCVSIIKDGRLVHDRSWSGTTARTPRMVYSITKSLTSLLIGMAADDGHLRLDDPASEQIEQWSGGPARDITVRDLLSMTSGRRFDETTDNQMIRSAPDKTAFSVGLAQDRPPGERWIYDNAAVQTLEAVLDNVYEQDDVAALGRTRLLHPLGMRDTIWHHDAAGNAMTYSGVESTCQDLARIGLLMLHRGAWRGEQIVSSAYVDQATGRSSSQLNAAYGLLWWVNHPGRVVEVLRQAGYPQDRPPRTGRLAPDVPSDAFWAYGYGDEFIAVIPSQNVVAVRLGRRPAGPDVLSFNVFTKSVLAALG